MPVITAAALKRFAPRADPRIVAAFVAHGDAAFARWDITTAARLRMFMAHVKVESAGLTVLFENMNYTAARIHAVWPSRFPTVAAAQRYSHNPQALADKVYGGRMGNTGPDDGWLCRGQGLLDNTGMADFALLAQHLGLTVDETRARLTSDDGMVDCAAATFHMLGCLPFADKGDLVGCTRRVNGGLNGLADRRTAFTLSGKVWPTMGHLDAALAPAPAVVPAPTPAVTRPAPVENHNAPAKPLRTPDIPAPSSWFDSLFGGLFGPATA